MATNCLLLICLYGIRTYQTQATAVPADCEPNHYRNKVSRICDPCPVICLQPRDSISPTAQQDCNSLAWSAGYCIGKLLNPGINSTSTASPWNNVTFLTSTQLPVVFNPVALGIFIVVAVVFSIAGIVLIARYVLTHRAATSEQQPSGGDEGVNLPLVDQQRPGVDEESHPDPDQGEHSLKKPAASKPDGLPTSREVDGPDDDDQPGPSTRPAAVEPVHPPENGQKQAMQDSSTEVADGEARSEACDLLERRRLGDVEPKPTD